MRFAFVGLGHAARWLHLPAVRSLPSAEVAGGADSSKESRVAWRQLEAGPAFDTFEELLNETSPDVVVIATPPDSHAELCLAALDAGAHVVCEKPFTETVEEAEKILHRATEVGRTVVVNQEFRYMPIYSCILPLIGSPGYGKPVFLQVTQFMDLAPWDEKVAWRAAMPNRTLFEGGVHIIDLIYAYMGTLPERVFAVTSSGLDTNREADAIHLVTLDFGEGRLAQITINRLSKTGTRYLDLRLDCEEASIRASHGGRAYVQMGIKRAQRPGIRVDFGLEGLAWVERGEQRKVLARNPRQVTVEATRRLYLDAFANINRGQVPPTSAKTARDTLMIIEAAYESARTGQPVTIAPRT
jgi:predicted dehydrogenase